MSTEPGQQSMVRRRAVAMIHEAFAANGIEFASPMVQVGKGRAGTAVVS
jgi:small-conductance mechanosensitive channel